MKKKCYIYIRMKNEEIMITSILDNALSEASVRLYIDTVVERVERNLENSPDDMLAWETIPLDIYGCSLPEEIKSNWVFILRKNTITGAERHPNSIQRMVAYRGEADFQTMPGAKWVSHLLVSGKDAKWLTIPANVWHQGVVGDENWVVVSFHTCKATELIEERPDYSFSNKVNVRKYIE